MLRFSESLLAYVWPVTLSAAAGSLAVFFVLVLVRLVRERRQDRRARRQKQIEQALLIHMANPLADPGSVLLKQAGDMAAVAQVAPSILRFLKGNSYRDMRATLAGIGLYDWALRQLDQRNRPRKIAAINLLAHWPDDTVKRRLRGLLDDRNHLVQFAAVEALANSRDTACLPAVLGVFQRQPAFSQPLMADVLRKFGAAASDQLVEVLTTGRTPVRIKSAALTALSRSGDRAGIAAAAPALCRHPDGALRALAFMALYHAGLPPDPALLRQGMRDDDWRVRQYVAGCASLARPLPTDVLAALLRDENWLVGLRAGQVLLGSGAAGGKLLQVIARNDARAAERARMLHAEFHQTHGGHAHGLA